MESRVKITGMTGFLFILFIFTGFAQETKTLPISEQIYNEYKENGVESAISEYQKVKKEKKAEITQAQLNAVAYWIMNNEKDMEAAGKIFRFNMEEYPKAANPYDSYGDYLVEKGNEKEAKEYFKKSAALSKDSSDEWEKNTLYPMTRSKMAKIDKKHKQMDFLLGNWNIDATAYEDGKEATKMKTKDKIEFDEEKNSIVIHHYNEQNEPEGVRIITYDALDDEFEVTYFSSDRLRGIEVSKMKMKTLGDNHFEFMDTFTTRDGEEMQLKHEIKKVSDSELDWVIMEENDKSEWQRVYAMNMTK